ncbi:uncharacterized protein LOC143084316 [Mytilus galloprovincialis]|uniref:uncharacterized protein LOC143084316 n=1 Tax=Mytilus galloprovincialis TaxID=29158 RepID=UPI003F7BDE70
MAKRKRKRIRYSYSFESRPICRECFKVCHDIGEKHLRNLKSHLDKNGKVPRDHGNAGKIPHNALKYDDTKRVVDFVVGFANEFGLPQPAAPRGRDDKAPVYLSSSETLLNLHFKYKSACETEEVSSVGKSSFRDIWLKCCPHIKICGPKDDVCFKCENFKQFIMDSTSEEDKLKYSSELQQHVEACKIERDVYKDWLQKSTDELYGVNRLPILIRPLLHNYRYIHYTFDFSQHFTLPHRCRQIGPMYFVTARKIHMFGVRVDGIPIQYNYLVDENETIGKDGSLIHGPNAVISMLHHSLTNYGYGERECGLHADNCGGQNKNKYVIAYFCWRVMAKLHSTIYYMMQIPGHARCLIDAGFAHSKRLYRRSDVDLLQDIAEIVDKSTASNKAVVMKKENNELEWEWRDWKTFFACHFKPLKGIRQYQQFRFSSDHPGCVFVKKKQQ